MRRLLYAFITLSALLCASQVFAQQAVGPITLQSTGAIGNGTAPSTVGLTLATVQVVAAGGFDRTLNFEVTEDATNYQAVSCLNVSTSMQSTTATVSGIYTCSIGGAQLFRARTSDGAANGTLKVSVTFNQGVISAGVASASSGTASSTTSAVSPVEGSTLFNTSTVSAAATALTTSIAGAATTRVHLYSASAYCSAGSATLTIKDGVAGTTIWVSPAGFVGTVVTSLTWTAGLTSTTANGMDIVLGSCGGANTGTLQVEADRF